MKRGEKPTLEECEAFHRSFMEELDRSATKEEVIGLIKKYAHTAGYRNVARWLVGQVSRMEHKAQKVQKAEEKS